MTLITDPIQAVDALVQSMEQKRKSEPVDPLKALRDHRDALARDIEINEYYLNDLREELEDAEDALQAALDERYADPDEQARFLAGVPSVAEGPL